MSASPARGSLVGVLQRRGRFLTAEPLFPSRDGQAGGTRRGQSSASIVLGGSRSSRRGEAREGDLVLVHLAGRGSGARVVRRLGRPDVAGDVLEALMLDRGLSRAFPATIEREATEAGTRVRSSPQKRRDLRELATFTVDPSSARDFDDAISAEEADGGRARVWVHIADVAAHVPEGSAIDREARRRATSVYVPGSVEPMLPHALSSDACSLVPGVPRAAVTVELELAGARVERAAFYRSLIRSDERLDYGRVDRIFAGVERARSPWGGPLEIARRVAGELQRRREQSGALTVGSSEPEFTFDEEGNVTDIRGRVQTESHRLIEHLMIAANEAVAELLRHRGVPCLYRVHERPQPERVKRLADQLTSLEIPTPAVPEPMSSSQATEVLGAISARVTEYLRRHEGRGSRALSSLVLRSLKQAHYSPENLGHAGLRSPAYCHFTSPIRRYPDLVCHRALLSAVGGGERAPRAGEMVELGAWTSEREREAMVIERDADDVASCFVLSRALLAAGPGAVLEGEITGLIAAGAFIAFAGPEGSGKKQGEVPPFEGMLPVRLLRVPESAAWKAKPPARPGRQSTGRERPSGYGGREWWELNEEGTILRGERTGATLRLGETLKVRVARVDAIRGQVDLEPAG